MESDTTTTTTGPALIVYRRFPLRSGGFRLMFVHDGTPAGVIWTSDRQRAKRFASQVAAEAVAEGCGGVVALDEEETR